MSEQRGATSADDLPSEQRILTATEMQDIERANILQAYFGDGGACESVTETELKLGVPRS